MSGVYDDRAVAEDGALGGACANGGEGEALVVLWRPPAAAAVQHGLQLLLEVVVEEAVDDGIDAGGRHGQEVAGGEDGVVVARRDGLVVPVEDGVEDVEREPADGEGHHDGGQHDVDPLGALGLLLPRVPRPLHHVAAPVEPQEDACVADQNERQGQKVLEDQQGGGVGQALLVGGPVLDAHKVVGEGVEGQREVVEGHLGEHVEGEEGERDEASHHPGDGHSQVGVTDHGLPAGGVDDELVALQGDQDHGEDGDGDGHALHEGRELAKRLAEDPVVHQRVDDRDRHAHETHQDVGEGEVGDEDVGDVPHFLLPGNDQDQAGVAHQPDGEHHAVCHD